MDDFIAVVLERWDEDDDHSLIPMKYFDKMVGYTVADIVFEGTEEECRQTVDKAIDIWFTIEDELNSKSFWKECMEVDIWLIYHLLHSRFSRLEEIECDRENGMRFVLINQAVINFHKFTYYFRQWLGPSYWEPTPLTNSILESMADLLDDFDGKHDELLELHFLKFIISHNVQHMSKPDFDGFNAMAERDWNQSARNIQIFAFRRYMQSLLPLEDLEKVCVGGRNGIGKNEPTIHVDPYPPYINPRGGSKYDRLSEHLKRIQPDVPKVPSNFDD